MCEVIGRIARVIALASVLAVAAAPAAHAAQAAPGKMEVVDPREPELEFVDVVYTQKPTQDNGLCKWFGPLQVLADVGFSAQLRQQSEEAERGRELTYNVAIASPFFEKRIIPWSLKQEF
jgi:hypothetical protein